MMRKRLLSLLTHIGFGVFFLTSCSPTLRHQPYLRIPVVISSTFGIPVIKVEIETIQCPVEIDLGSAYQLRLNPKVLKKIKNKKQESNAIKVDIHGNLYETQSFQLPSIRLKNWEIKDVIVSEELDTYVSNTILWLPPEAVKKQVIEKDAKIRQGAIGWPVFSQFACLFDFAHGAIVIGENMANLLEAGLSMSRFISLPFNIDKGGIILSIATDLGTHQFLLDTGVTCSIIRQRLIPKENIEKTTSNIDKYTTDILCFNGNDLGPWTFRLFKISEFYNQLDGILGVDFFRRHAICLDFRNKIAYIEKLFPFR